MFAPKGNDGRTAQEMSGRGGRSYGIDVIQLGTLTDLSVFGSLPSARAASFGAFGPHLCHL